MRYYSLKMSLAASAHQSQLVQELKSAGDDVIQTSDGLCVKSMKSIDEIESFLKEKEMEGISVEEINPASAEDLPRDVSSFMGL